MMGIFKKELPAAERESVKSALATHWSEIMKPLMQRIEALSDRSRMQKQP